jgi:hypothetical protein
MVATTLLGVAALLGVTESQLNPIGLVEAVALKVSVELSVLVTEMVCCVTAVDPAKAVTLMAPWLTFNNAVLLTFSETGICNEVEVPGTLSTTFPLQACAVARPAMLTDTTIWFWLP